MTPAGETPVGAAEALPTADTRRPGDFPTRVDDLRLPARLGLALCEPRRALARVDVVGGGLGDAAWLVLIGIACFRLEDLMRALLGITHLSFGTVIRQMLAVVSYEDREAMIVILPAAIAVTLAAGRGRRDPSRDFEIAALAYVPFFTVRALFRTLDLEAFFGPLPPAIDQLFLAAAFLWACVFLGMAIATARRRELPPVRAGGSSLPPVPPLPSELPVIHPLRRSRVTVAAVGALLGAAFFVNLGWVLRNASAIRPLVRGKRAPDFSLARIDGQPGEVRLSALEGKVVLLDFWASWCQPCVRMLPSLNELYGQWQARGVEFVGINSDGATVSAQELSQFMAEHQTPYPMVIDRTGDVGSQYKVVALPHIVVVGRDGSIAKTFWGVTSVTELASVLGEEINRPTR